MFTFKFTKNKNYLYNDGKGLSLEIYPYPINYNGLQSGEKAGNRGLFKAKFGENIELVYFNFTGEGMPKKLDMYVYYDCGSGNGSKQIVKSISITPKEKATHVEGRSYELDCSSSETQ